MNINLRIYILGVFLCLASQYNFAQVTLGTSPYIQDFDALPTLPAGWTVRTGASATSLGVTNPISLNTWAANSPEFRTVAAAEAPLAAGSNATAQSGAVDRALAIRTGVAFGEPGAAITLQIDNTIGKTGFSLSMKHMTFDDNTSRTSTFTVQYTTVAAGTSGWTDLGTYTTATWGVTNANYVLGSALDNISSSVWVRIIFTSGSSATGGRDTYGIDDFKLTWATSATPGINITSPNPAAAAVSLAQGTINAVIYRADLAVSSSSAVMNLASFTTSGSYIATDLVNLKLWYQNTSTFSGTGTLVGTITTGLGIGVHNFSGISQIFPITTGYLFLTADIACTATNSNNFRVNAVGAGNFTFVAGSATATPAPFTGGLQTIIIGGIPQNVSSAAVASGNGQSTISWINPPCYDEIMILATDNAGITTAPTGDGTLYTANTAYNDGTNFPNLNPNEFCIYRGTVSPVIMTSLLNGTAYNLKVFTRLGTVWSSGIPLSTTPSTTLTFPFRSKASGQWNDYNTWEKNTGSWVAAAAGEFPNSTISDVQIRAGHTVTLNARGYAIKNLTVDVGGKLYAATNIQNKFLNIYGDVLCNGIIGNGSVQDDVSFNIGGPTCHMYGTGVFDCDRIRKNTGSSATTTLTIDINIGTWYNGTVLWNNYTGAGAAFNVIINSAFTCNNSGIVAIDGLTGTATGSSYGTFTVNGTLTVGGTLYLTTNNISPYNCTLAIGAAGVVNATTVSMGASTGTASHILSIAGGGKLNITGVSGISPFSLTGNTYTLSAGSTVEYSAAGAEPVESALSYSNLTVSGSGAKTPNGNVSVGNIFTLTAGTFNMTGLQVTVAANGAVTGNGGNFGAGVLGGVVSFSGNGSINGTTALTFRNLNINAGTVTTALTNCSAQNLNLTGGIFSIGAANQFNMLTGGVVTATAGDFATGVNGGILNFTGSGIFSGVSNPYNVYTSGAVNFGTQTVTIQNGGSCRLNAGGTVTSNPPFYATNSTLVYNTGASNPAAIEWTAGTSSGRGVPYHVTLLAINTAVNFAALATSRTMLGNLTINNGTTLTLSTAGGGDLLIAGNWTRAATGTFVSNARKVTFNGTSADQTITVSGGGNEKFGSMIINKAAGLKLIQAAAPDATNIILNGNPASVAPSVTLSLFNGSLDLNQQTFNFTSWNGNQNNIQIDGTSGNLSRYINSTGGAGFFIVSNSNAAPHTLTVSRATAAASLLVFSTGVTLINGAVGPGSGGIDFGNTLTTINGTLQLNSNGLVNGSAPSYGINSFLVYNSGGNFDRNVEWNALAGPGYPYNVTVQNNTALRLNFPAVNGNADRAIAGNLSIASGASLLLSTTAGNTLTVTGNLQLDGTLTLPTAAGGNLYLGGNWTRTASGIFTPNDQAVFFNTATNASITASGGQLFPFIYLVKGSVSNTLTLLDDISITKEFAITSGTFDPANKNATLKSNAAATASFGRVGATGAVTYSGTGRFIVERYIPTGTLTGQHGKSWQYLGIPDNGGQTINAGWQEGNILPAIGTAGLGIIISNNVAGAGFDMIAGVGPTMKTYVAASATWVGVGNTLLIPLYNQKGYFVFVRGDRNVSAYNAPATPTTLRSTGKLFVPGSNPAPSTTVAAGKFESIGNPYASAIDFLNITRPAAPAIDSTFYVWDPLLAGSYGLGGFQTISSVTGYKPTPGGTLNYSSALPYTTIQSGQAFMVHSTGGGGTLSFTENAKVSGSKSAYRQTMEITAKQYLKAALYTGTGTLADANVLAVHKNYSNEYESNDALKILNSGENFGIQSHEHILSIEAKNNINNSDTIHYFLKNLRLNQAYRLFFSPENIYRSGLTAYLYDNILFTRTLISLRDSTIVDFIAGNATDEKRFFIVFKYDEEINTTGVIPVKPNPKTVSPGREITPSFSVYPNPAADKNIHINFTDQPAGMYTLQLINGAGQILLQKVFAVTGNDVTRSISLRHIPIGYYNVAVINTDYQKTLVPLLIR